MANRTMGDIELALRKRAAAAARNEFSRAETALLSPGHSVTCSDKFTHEEFEQLRMLLRKYMETQVVPKACDKAVREFVAKYEMFIAEMPTILEGIVSHGE